MTHASVHTRNLKILLVDDDVEAIVPVHKALAGEGNEITIAFGGRSAIDHLLKKPFDLVILDWRMPDLDGDEVLREIQALFLKDKMRSERKNINRIPFITYSSCAFRDVKIPNCENFDFVGHWQKPMTSNKLTFLTTEIISWLNGR